MGPKKNKIKEESQKKLRNQKKLGAGRMLSEMPTLAY